jgi:formyl-CoA transferase
MRKRPRAEWLKLLDGAGVPGSPLHKLSELSDHPHLRESGMRFDYVHPVLGALSGISQPIRIDSERMPFRTPPPLHGQHSADILQELNYTKEEIDRITQAGR